MLAFSGGLDTSYGLAVLVDRGGASRTLMLDARDLEAQWELQRRIDTGRSRFFILSPGLVNDRVPILEIATDNAGT